ncbi:MAG: UvrD-helicase domain-containing protein [Leuconostoc mesenteroides]
MTTNLTKIQQEIIDISGNLVVSSSAGTGKTHTLVAKIAKEIEENKDHRVIAAITFTIKASKEIRDRLSLNFGNNFIGTNNSFAIEEVIVPFMKDAFGDIYDCPMSTDYENSFSNFNEGLRCISDEGALGVYNDTKKNFVFELALKVLKESEVARLYLKAKYFKIYIDEYQDCDLTMNKFFMYLTDTLQIDLFIVGDYKQSLYIWRGATPQAFQNLFAKKVVPIY